MDDEDKKKRYGSPAPQYVPNEPLRSMGEQHARQSQGEALKPKQSDLDRDIAIERQRLVAEHEATLKAVAAQYAKREDAIRREFEQDHAAAYARIRQERGEIQDRQSRRHHQSTAFNEAAKAENVRDEARRLSHQGIGLQWRR